MADKADIERDFFHNRRTPAAVTISDWRAGLNAASFLAFAGLIMTNIAIFLDASPGLDRLSNLLVFGASKVAVPTLFVLAGTKLAHLTSLWRKLDLRRVLGIVLSALLLSAATARSFEADMMHQLIPCLIIAALSVSWRSVYLVCFAIALLVVQPIGALILGLEAGHLVTEQFQLGPVISLFFTGWYPVLPWLAFVIVGVLIARMEMTDPKILISLVMVGVVMLIAAYALSWILPPAVPTYEEISLIPLVGMEPLIPSPMFMVQGMGAAILCIGLCQMGVRWFGRTLLFRSLIVLGQDVFTLYILHILVGMNLLRYLDPFGSLGSTLGFGQTLGIAGLQIGFAVLFSLCWRLFHAESVLEMLLWRLLGAHKA